MTKVIILDDEHILSNALKQILELNHPDLNIVAVCSNIQEAEDAINKFNPDLAFLDVELGDGETSFDLLAKISAINFKIIFITAYSKYSIQAIKFSALDYLLKPIGESELKIAIEKFQNKKNRTDSGKTESLLSALISPGNQRNRIPLPTKTGYDLVAISDIVYCEVSNNLTSVVLNDNRILPINLTLVECEEILEPYRFFRIHKSYLINLNHIRKYIKGQDGIAVVSNDKNLTVSRNFKKKFLEKLKKS